MLVPNGDLSQLLFFGPADLTIDSVARDDLFSLSLEESLSLWWSSVLDFCSLEVVSAFFLVPLALNLYRNRIETDLQVYQIPFPFSWLHFCQDCCREAFSVCNRCNISE